MELVLLLQCLYQVVFFFVMVYAWRISGDRVSGLGFWTLNLLLNSIGLILGALTLNSSSKMAEIIATLLVTGGGVLFYFGLAAFSGHKPKAVPMIGGTGGLIAAAIVCILIDAPRQYVLILYAIAFIYICIFYFLVYIPAWRTWYRAFALSLAAVYAVIIVLQVTRIVLLTSSLLPKETINSQFEDPVLSLTSLTTRFLLFMVNVVILMLVNRKLVHDLEIDAQQKEQMIRDIRVISETDALTGLLNRMSIERKIEGMITETQSGGAHSFGILLVDIDYFKTINDEYGHDVGDEILLHIAALLRTCVRGEDSVGRWGGDEFLVIVYETGAWGAETAGKRILEGIGREASEKPNLHLPTVSIGFTVYRHEDTLQSLLKRADIHMYRAKKQGRNQICGSP
ncbi:MAG: GGDEF domain-containing protein [Spirochaetota bacterium]